MSEKSCPYDHGYQIGTSWGLSKDTLDKNQKELDKYLAETGHKRPDRGDLTDPSHKWIFGKPDYRRGFDKKILKISGRKFKILSRSSVLLTWSI